MNILPTASKPADYSETVCGGEGNDSRHLKIMLLHIYDTDTKSESFSFAAIYPLRNHIDFAPVSQITEEMSFRCNRESQEEVLDYSVPFTIFVPQSITNSFYILLLPYSIPTIPKPIKVTAAQLLDRLRYSKGVADVDPRIHGRCVCSISLPSEGVSQATLKIHGSLSITALALCLI